MKRVLLILALWAVTGTAGLSGAPFDVTLRRAEDAAGITTAGEAVVVTITSKRGIGGAQLIRSGAAWPARLVLRLKLNNLESLKLANGRIRIETSLRSARETPYWKIGAPGGPAAAPAGTLAMTITQTAAGIEVVVPPLLLDGNPPEIVCEWINEYRG